MKFAGGITFVGGDGLPVTKKMTRLTSGYIMSTWVGSWVNEFGLLYDLIWVVRLRIRIGLGYLSWVVMSV